MFFSHGKIIYSIGSVVITEEGLRNGVTKDLEDILYGCRRKDTYGNNAA